MMSKEDDVMRTVVMESEFFVVVMREGEDIVVVNYICFCG